MYKISFLISRKKRKNFDFDKMYKRLYIKIIQNIINNVILYKCTVNLVKFNSIRIILSYLEIHILHPFG